MKIILTGGGTGGHVAPALSVAKILRERIPNCEIAFIGRRGGGENNAVKKAGIPLYELEIYGIKRSLSPSNLKRILTALRAKNKAEKIIKDFSPDVVLGTGGYVCWPVLSAAHKMNIPTAIHESNAYPGLVTRLLAKQSTAVFLNHHETARHLKCAKNFEEVGNPVNPEIYRTNRVDARQSLGLDNKKIFILSFGGSGGSDMLNKAVLEVMTEISSKSSEIFHLHATGRTYYEKWQSTKKNLPGCKVVPYIDDMPKYLRSADIVISRCGAMTLSELSAAGCCSVLIPSPNVTADHQRKNASLYSTSKAAIVIEEEHLSSGALISTVKELIGDSEARKNLSSKIVKFRTPKSAYAIADKLIKLASSKK